MLICACTYAFMQPPVWVILIMMIPLVIDGFTQKLTAYESTNGRRFFTGVLFGYAFLFLILWSLSLTYWAGYHTFERMIGVA